MPCLRDVQRGLTLDFLNRRRLNAPPIWMNPESAAPAPASCGDINEWLNPNDERNLGVRLVDGFVELRIAAPDDAWTRHFFAAADSLSLDARASWGTETKVHSVVFAAESEKIDGWIYRWPKGGYDRSHAWIETELVHSLKETKRSRAVWRDSKPLPGSRINGSLAVWRPRGRPATDDLAIGLDDLEAYQLQTVSLENVIRAIAFATLAYWIEVYLEGQPWDEILTKTIGGWLARTVLEGQDINARGKSLEGVCWAPVDSSETAYAAIRALKHVGADYLLERAYALSESLLERNRSHPVPGWSSLESLFGLKARIAIRKAFRSGIDLDLVEQMSERYIYDTSDHKYLDREMMLKSPSNYQHSLAELTETWDNNHIYLNNKPYNPFRLYARSALRTDVTRREFRPAHSPGAVLRYSKVHGIIGNDRDVLPDEYKLFNTYCGLPLMPIAAPDPDIMCVAISHTDRMLSILTRDNDDQMRWIKQFLAAILKFPGEKWQACLMIFGGQGTGKSFLGIDFLNGLFGYLAGTVDAAALNDNKFLITPFLNKLVVFIDEVKLESVSAINSIKKVVRSEYVSGQKKFEHQTDFYVPARVVIASNTVHIGLTPDDAADRCNFIVMAPNAENMRLTDNEFAEWALTLKTFYSEFAEDLKSPLFRQHLIRHLVDIEVERADVEDMCYSSRNQETVVRSTMSKARKVARAIAADARVLQNRDICAWFGSIPLRKAIERIDGTRSKIEVSQVLLEYERAGVLETMRGDQFRFKYRYATLLERLGQAHNLPILPNWSFQPDDWGENDADEGGLAWRGSRKAQSRARSQVESEDFEY